MHRSESGLSSGRFRRPLSGRESRMPSSTDMLSCPYPRMPPLRLSVLDQSPIPEGSTVGDALRNTLDLARAADRLGYARYWLGGDHATPGLACASPEVMIGLVAEAAANLRVGSGGIMLPHYSPLKVAETFSM